MCTKVLKLEIGCVLREEYKTEKKTKGNFYTDYKLYHLHRKHFSKVLWVKKNKKKTPAMQRWLEISGLK